MCIKQGHKKLIYCRINYCCIIMMDLHLISKICKYLLSKFAIANISIVFKNLSTVLMLSVISATPMQTTHSVCSRVS